MFGFALRITAGSFLFLWFEHSGTIEGKLLKRGKDKNEWNPRRCLISFATSAFRYYRLAKDATVDTTVPNQVLPTVSHILSYATTHEPPRPKLPYNFPWYHGLNRTHNRARWLSIRITVSFMDWKFNHQTCTNRKKKVHCVYLLFLGSVLGSRKWALWMGQKKYWKFWGADLR